MSDIGEEEERERSASNSRVTTYKIARFRFYNYINQQITRLAACEELKMMLLSRIVEVKGLVRHQCKAYLSISPFKCSSRSLLLSAPFMDGEAGMVSVY